MQQIPKRFSSLISCAIRNTFDMNWAFFIWACLFTFILIVAAVIVCVLPIKHTMVNMVLLIASMIAYRSYDNFTQKTPNVLLTHDLFNVVLLLPLMLALLSSWRDSTRSQVLLAGASLSLAFGAVVYLLSVFIGSTSFLMSLFILLAALWAFYAPVSTTDSRYVYERFRGAYSAPVVGVALVLLAAITLYHSWSVFAELMPHSDRKNIKAIYKMCRANASLSAALTDVLNAALWLVASLLFFQRRASSALFGIAVLFQACLLYASRLVLLAMLPDHSALDALTNALAGVVCLAPFLLYLRNTRTVDDSPDQDYYNKED